MALYATQNSAKVERRNRATKRLQIAHAVLAALSDVKPAGAGGVAGGKPLMGVNVDRGARPGGSAAAAPVAKGAGGGGGAGGGRELDAAALARRKYRHDVLGIDDIRNATPEQLAAARSGSGIGASAALPTHDQMLAQLAQQRAQAESRGRAAGRAVPLVDRASRRRRRGGWVPFAPGGGSG
jgi:hypothetical protein